MRNDGFIPFPFSRKPVFCNQLRLNTLNFRIYSGNLNVLLLTTEYFDVYIVVPFFCPLVYLICELMQF